MPTVAAPKAAHTSPRRQQRARLGPLLAVASTILSIQRALADPATASPETVLALQQRFGNRAVQRLLSPPADQATRSPVQAQRQNGAGRDGGPLDAGLSRAIETTRGGGRPLPPQVSQPFESALGADFGRVRVHTDARADTLNRSLSARAFTYGSDIYFSRGAYNPASSSGQRLLAHELTHVVQQGGAPGAKPNRVQTKPAALAGRIQRFGNEDGERTEQTEENEGPWVAKPLDFAFGTPEKVYNKLAYGNDPKAKPGKARKVGAGVAAGLAGLGSVPLGLAGLGAGVGASVAIGAGALALAPFYGLGRLAKWGYNKFRGKPSQGPDLENMGAKQKAKHLAGTTALGLGTLAASPLLAAGGLLYGGYKGITKLGRGITNKYRAWKEKKALKKLTGLQDQPGVSEDFDQEENEEEAGLSVPERTKDEYTNRMRPGKLGRLLGKRGVTAEGEELDKRLVAMDKGAGSGQDVSYVQDQQLLEDETRGRDLSVLREIASRNALKLEDHYWKFERYLAFQQANNDELKSLIAAQEQASLSQDQAKSSKARRLLEKYRGYLTQSEKRVAYATQAVTQGRGWARQAMIHYKIIEGQEKYYLTLTSKYGRNATGFSQEEVNDNINTMVTAARKRVGQGLAWRRQAAMAKFTTKEDKRQVKDVEGTAQSFMAKHGKRGATAIKNTLLRLLTFGAVGAEYRKVGGNFKGKFTYKWLPLLSDLKDGWAEVKQTYKSGAFGGKHANRAYAVLKFINLLILKPLIALAGSLALWSTILAIPTGGATAPVAAGLGALTLVLLALRGLINLITLLWSAIQRRRHKNRDPRKYGQAGQQMVRSGAGLVGDVAGVAVGGLLALDVAGGMKFGDVGETFTERVTGGFQGEPLSKTIDVGTQNVMGHELPLAASGAVGTTSLGPISEAGFGVLGEHAGFNRDYNRLEQRRPKAGGKNLKPMTPQLDFQVLGEKDYRNDEEDFRKIDESTRKAGSQLNKSAGTFKRLEGVLPPVKSKLQAKLSKPQPGTGGEKEQESPTQEHLREVQMLEEHLPENVQGLEEARSSLA